MQEYLKSVLPSAGTPAASWQEASCPDLENLERTVEEILEARMGGLEAKMGGVEAKMGEVEAKMTEMAADMMAADDSERDARSGGGNADGGAGRHGRHPSPGMCFAR